ncbi:MAG: hypothetical protein AAF649_03940 [Verrucomicrobiota bacterium]
MSVFRYYIPALASLLLIFIGCTSPQKRAEENPEAFAKLSKAQQRMVLEGRIEEGMNEDAVFIALGRPTKKRDMRIEGENINNWIYSRTLTEVIPAYRDRYYRGYNGRLYRSCYYDPYYRSYVVDTFRVMFKQGRVVGWEELN